MERAIDLSRFVTAHEQSYRTALGEIRNGRKVSHWMWYIFPQLRGLGNSQISRYYAVRGLDEAAAFLKDPYLTLTHGIAAEPLLQGDPQQSKV